MGGLNLYAYVTNNPTNLVDPDGEAPFLIPGGIAAYRAYNLYKAYRLAKAAGDLARANRLLQMARRSKAIARNRQAAARNRQAELRKLSQKPRPASEKTAIDIGKRIERDFGGQLGRELRREFHDVKQNGGGDRTLEQLKQDACDIYRQYGKEIPSWLR